MAILDLSTAKQETSLRAKFFAELDNLQPLAAKLFPGYTLVLSSEIEHPEFPLRPEGFASKTGTEQIQDAMAVLGRPAELDAILDGIRAKGGKMERPSLMTLLSRGKSKGLFGKFGHGRWGLPEHNTQPEGGTL